MNNLPKNFGFGILLLFVLCGLWVSAILSLGSWIAWVCVIGMLIGFLLWVYFCYEDGPYD